MGFVRQGPATEVELASEAERPLGTDACRLVNPPEWKRVAASDLGEKTLGPHPLGESGGSRAERPHRKATRRWGGLTMTGPAKGPAENSSGASASADLHGVRPVGWRASVVPLYRLGVAECASAVLRPRQLELTGVEGTLARRLAKTNTVGREDGRHQPPACLLISRPSAELPGRQLLPERAE